MTVALTPDLLRTMRQPDPEEGAKEGRGSIGVIGGSREVVGAVLLAGTAALRVGAGKLQLATAATVAPSLGLHLPEALVIGVGETADGEMVELDGETIDRFGRSDAILVGPGMMSGKIGDATLRAVMTRLPDPALVLDAGILTALADQADLLRSRGGRAIVTPHAGEMAKLLGKERKEIEDDPLVAAREAAGRFGVVAIMKGARTFVVDPAGGEWCYEGGCVGLATSGSGDVLAGIVAGALARGSTPSAAALWGVFLHGEAGTRLSERHGRLGFLARELLEEIPGIASRLERAWDGEGRG